MGGYLPAGRQGSGALGAVVAHHFDIVEVRGSNPLVPTMEKIYEDNDLLVINKPAGIVITDIYPDLFKIHRLDRDTSGILLIAKNEKDLIFFQKQFKNRKVDKKYLALVVGEIKQNEGEIKSLIGRGINDRKKQKVYSPIDPNIAGAREALTKYKVIKRFSAGSGDYTLLEVFPKTGRKHQIRVHLAYINHPIVGDKVYGFKNQPSPMEMKQHFLHANCIKIKMLNGEVKEFCALLPEELQQVINNLSTSEL